jgi:uncharacterized protein (TIGR03435 family)
MIRCCLLVLLVSAAFAQNFEIASVKASPPPGAGTPRAIIKGGPGTPDPTQLTWSNLAMRAILLRAYGIQNYQLTAPKWVDIERFDISARIPAGATAEQFRAMLRNLLKDRFHLVAREETKEGQVYALVVGKTSSKLKESTEAAAPENEAAPASAGPPKFEGGFPVLPPGPGLASVVLNGSVKMTAQAQTMARLAAILGAQLDREVVDQTGLKGRYDFHLSYTPESVLAFLPPGEPRPDMLGSDVFTALGEQLGLKLESRKGPVRMIFVDSIEHIPTEN